MKRVMSLLLLTCAMITGCAQPVKMFAPLPAPQTISGQWLLQDAAKVLGSSEEISSLGYDTGDWYRAAVPGTVLTTLVANGVYPEPLFGENNRPDKIPETLCRTTYWYRTEWPINKPAADRHLWLHFEGINYIAEIWVNGNLAGTINGAFSRGNFDVTEFVAAKKIAVIAVHILPPPDPGNPLEQTVKLGDGPNGGILAQDGPTFLCTIGWDWIPGIRDRNIGIWRDVSLAESGPLLIEDPLVYSKLPLPRTDSADVTVSARVHNISEAQVTGRLDGAIGDVQFSKDVTLKADESRVITFDANSTPVLHLTKPRLWWPNGYGGQNLYPLHLQASADGNVSDIRDLSFGVREITYEIKGSPYLTISVNGVPIICKGGDWGMDEAMKRIPRSRLEAEIRMHQQAHYTMIRNWVGQSTSEDFYDLCDRYGILVWDEFFQPNPSDGPNPVDVPLYLSNVREKVLRYRNHPCIALWCARNEGNPPHAIDAGIRGIMKELEPLRLYQKNSADGRGVRSGGPYCWRTPQEYYRFPADEAFKTEIGSVSIPTLEAIQHMMPPKDWDTINDDWAEHDMASGAQQGDLFPIRLARRYGPTQDLNGFVREGTLATYEAFRAMYEGRFGKLFAPVSGVITWMSNPAQPSMVWQLYTHDLEPNAALFAVQKACEPVHIQMNQTDSKIMLVNALPAPVTGARVRLRILNLDGTLADQKMLPASGTGSAATEIGKIKWPERLSATHFVKLELFDASDRLLSENFYWRSTRISEAATLSTSQPASGKRRKPDGPTEDLTDLQTMPPAEVSLSWSTQSMNGLCHMSVTLRNRGNTIALMTHLQLRRAASGERVLPVFYSDNYLSLLPGESRKVEIEAAIASLNGEIPRVAMDGWNVARQ